jgi:hypothetical protein
MNRFITRTLKFLLILAVLYPLFILLWGMLFPESLQKNLVYKLGGKGFMFSRMQEVKQTRDVDILFVGSSLAIRGFDPRIFSEYGFKTFNMGSGGQTPLQSAWLMERYIDSLRPKMIIVEVNPFIISRDGVEAGLDLISNHEFEWSLLKMGWTINSMKVYNTLIYAWWRKLLGLNNNFVEETKKGDDTYITGGFVEKEISYFNPSDFHKEPKYALKPIPYQEKSLELILNMIIERNIELVLIQPPVTKTAFRAYEDHYNIDQYFSSLGSYYNCNYYTDLNDSLHFYDSRHLNQHGVEIFNRVLIEDILKINDDNRKRPGFQN